MLLLMPNQQCQSKNMYSAVRANGIGGVVRYVFFTLDHCCAWLLLYFYIHISTSIYILVFYWFVWWSVSVERDKYISPRVVAFRIISNWGLVENRVDGCYRYLLFLQVRVDILMGKSVFLIFFNQISVISNISEHTWMHVFTVIEFIETNGTVQVHA